MPLWRGIDLTSIYRYFSPSSNRAFINFVKSSDAIIFKTALNFPASLQSHIVAMWIVSSTKDERATIVLTIRLYRLVCFYC